MYTVRVYNVVVMTVGFESVYVTINNYEQTKISDNPVELTRGADFPTLSERLQSIKANSPLKLI